MPGPHYRIAVFALSHQDFRNWVKDNMPHSQLLGERPDRILLDEYGKIVEFLFAYAPRITMGMRADKVILTPRFRSEKQMTESEFHDWQMAEERLRDATV